MLFLKLAFAGLGPMIFHYGIGIGIIVICVMLYVCFQMLPLFLQGWLEPVKQDLIWVAVVVALCLGYGTVIARDMAHRCDAKSAVIEHVTTKAVTNADGNPANDKFNIDK